MSIIDIRLVVFQPSWRLNRSSRSRCRSWWWRGDRLDGMTHGIPILPGRYVPHDTWRETAKMREDAMRNRHMREVEKLSQGTKNLPSLEIADKVRVQNQHGPNPLKWDKTGIVVEKKDYDQYIVKMDGSGRVTLRNRKFLRKYKPYYRREDQLFND